LRPWIKRQEQSEEETGVVGGRAAWKRKIFNTCSRMKEQLGDLQQKPGTMRIFRRVQEQLGGLCRKGQEQREDL
jgi:hypothetical protein